LINFRKDTITEVRNKGEFMAKKYTKSYARRVAHSNGQWREKIRLLNYNVAIFLTTNDYNEKILTEDELFMLDGWLRNSPYNFQYQEAKRSHAAFLPYWSLIRERVNWLGWQCQIVRGLCLALASNQQTQLLLAEYEGQGIDKNNTIAEFFIVELNQIEQMGKAILEMRKAAEDVRSVDNLNRAYFEHCLPVGPYIQFNLEWVRVGIASWEETRKEVLRLVEDKIVELDEKAVALVVDWNTIPGQEFTKDFVMEFSRMEHI
jgi:hypothetical protein